MREDNIDQIYRFLTAYDFKEVKEAFKLLNREKLSIKLEYLKRRKKELSENGWEEFHGEEIPVDHEWFKIGERIFIRSFEKRDRILIDQIQDQSLTHESVNQGSPKTDLSMNPTDKVCPLCGEVMAWEPICPGCKLGRQGFKGRYVCMADFDHTYYMLREGLDLPNR